MKKKTLILIIVIIFALMISTIIGFIIYKKNEEKKINEFKDNIKNYINLIEKQTKLEEENYINKNLNSRIDLDDIILDIIGNNEVIPTSGYFLTNEDGKVENACFIAKLDKKKYKVNYNKDIELVETTTDCDNANLSISMIKKENGTEIYFNPETGKKCSIKEYENNENASKNGNTSGCMKWYVFLDEEGKEYVNLLLDHNTTPLIAWSKDGVTSNGPSNAGKIMDYLKNDTEKWEGLKNRNDSYTLTRENSTYTIDYSEYKARLISAEEIAKISNNNDFDVVTAKEKFYFGSNTIDDKTKRDNYKWLFSSLGGCKSYCINPDATTYRETNGVARSIIFGYWTSSSVYDTASDVWVVYNDGSLRNEHSNLNAHYGIRPVITIKKSLIY